MASFRFIFFATFLCLIIDGSILNSFKGDIGIYFDREDWSDDSKWITSNVHHINSETIHEKCLSKLNCYCSHFSNHHYRILDISKVKVFNCDMDDISAALQLDFNDLKATLFDEEEDTYNLAMRDGNNRAIPMPTTGVKTYPADGNAHLCPISYAMHHIVPKQKIQEFWNYLARSDAVSKKALFIKLAVAVSTRIKQFYKQYNLGGPYNWNHGTANEYNVAQTNLHRAVYTKNKKKKEVLKDLEKEHYNKGKPTFHFEKIKNFYIWTGGDIFAGPESGSRSDDPNNGFERAVKYIKHRVTLTDDAYNALEVAYRHMTTVKNGENPTDAELTTTTDNFIQYGINGDFIPFRFADWQIAQDGNNLWKWNVIPRARRRLLSYNNYYNKLNYDHGEEENQEIERELTILNDIPVILDKNDWFDHNKWTKINKINYNKQDIHQKCNGINQKNCYCRIDGRHKKSASNVVNVYQCYFDDISSANMMDNNLLIFGGNQWSTQFDQAGAVDIAPGLNCPIPLARHHIIPQNILKGFWDKMAENNKLDTMRPILQNWMGGNYPMSDIDKLLKAIYNGDATHNAGSEPHGAQDVLAAKWMWTPGNIFIGPKESLRADDAKSKFESLSEPILGNPKFIALKGIYGDMKDYIADPSGKEATLGAIATNFLEQMVNQAVTDFDGTQWQIHDNKWRIIQP